MGWTAGSKATRVGEAIDEARSSFAMNDGSEPTPEDVAQYESAVKALEEIVAHLDPERTIKARCQGHIRQGQEDSTGTFISVVVAEHMEG